MAKAKRIWCNKCQMGQDVTKDGTCPRCGRPLPNERTRPPKPEKEIVSRGGYTKDTNYEAKVEWKPEEKEVPKGGKPKRKVSEATRKKISGSLKRKYRKRKDT